MRFICLSILALLMATPAMADDEQSPYAYVTSAQWGRHYFKMLPDPKKAYRHDAGLGICYAVGRDGKDKELWRTSGWYAFSTHLSYDGRYLVRIGNWPRGHAPSKDHVGIAFYERGKLTRSYSTAELIGDRSKVQPSVSHYQFKKKVIGFGRAQYAFELVVIDGVTWRFDVRTGAVLGKK